MAQRMYIAFQKGTFTNLYHDVIMGSTWGRFVHCELIFQNKGYAAYEGLSGFTNSLQESYPKKGWTVLSHDIADHEKAHAIILHTLGCNIPYNKHDLWQCVLPGGVYVCGELNYEAPETWKQGVFCSQAGFIMFGFLKGLKLLLNR
jgi:hypothetical protein